MKNTHTCPKCNSTEIIKIAGPATVGYTNNQVPLGWFKAGNVDRYVCVSCGYSEEWIAKEKDLDRLAKKHLKDSQPGDGFV